MGVGKWIKNSIIQMIGGQELVFGCMLKHSPYQVGDILWVREKSCFVLHDHAHDLLEGFKEKRQTIYGTDMHDDWMRYAKEKYGYKWTPSLFMPKETCRIFLKIIDVGVERLQDISEEDAKKEGIQSWLDSIDNFKQLWQSINGEKSWTDNQWVWVIEFERIELTEKQKNIFYNKN